MLELNATRLGAKNGADNESVRLEVLCSWRSICQVFSVEYGRLERPVFNLQ
jgi:hypothetical protein